MKENYDRICYVCRHFLYSYCKKTKVKWWYILDVIDSVNKSANIHGFYNLFLKPMIDWVFAGVIFILFSPFFVLIMILIKLDSQGSALFVQRRIGLKGKEFNIYKFRTMYTHVPKEGRSPISDQDPRITKVGKFLRKTSLDEVPQLLNILKGEMSFIGPRPEQKSIVEQYYTDYENQRFLAKPGITGLWQVSMERILPIHENIHYDLNYIKQVSLWLDIKIIFKTIGVMLKRNNTH